MTQVEPVRKDEGSAWPAGVLLVVQALLAGIGYFANAFHGLGVAGCSPTCDYALLGESIQGYIWIAIAAFVVAALFVVLWWRRPRIAIWGPLAGIAVTIAAFVMSSLFIGTAIQG